MGVDTLLHTPVEYPQHLISIPPEAEGIEAIL